MSYQVRRGNYAWEIFTSKSEYGVSWEDAVKMLIRLSLVDKGNDRDKI